MGSYEGRIQAVKLYTKLGKRLRATIRQLGYPTKNSLMAGTGSTSGVRACESNRPPRFGGGEVLAQLCLANGSQGCWLLFG